MKLSTIYIPDNIFYSQNVASAFFGEDGECCAGEYRFGFNGMELDNEFYGAGNTYDFGARIYDSRLGRWMSVDPLFKIYPSLSPYVSMGNNPILIVDVDGRYIVVRGQDNQNEMLNVIKSSFSSDVAKDFSFNHQGVLQFSGNINDLKGLDKKLAKPLLKVMDAKYVVRVSFEKNDQTDAYGGAVANRNSDSDGNIVGGSIIIDPDISRAYNKVSKIVYKGIDGNETDDKNKAAKVEGAYGVKTDVPIILGERTVDVPINSNKVVAFFHEIGHFAFWGKRKENVIKYENVSRKTQNLEKRTIDNEHTGKE